MVRGFRHLLGVSERMRGTTILPFMYPDPLKWGHKLLRLAWPRDTPCPLSPVLCPLQDKAAPMARAHCRHPVTQTRWGVPLLAPPCPHPEPGGFRH